MRTALINLASKLAAHHLLRMSLAGIVAVSTSAAADTTNRALQVSPVPGIFVGGVGLLCEPHNTDSNSSKNRPEFLLLTKNRESLGWANLFNDDDIRRRGSPHPLSILLLAPTSSSTRLFRSLG